MYEQFSAGAKEAWKNVTATARMVNHEWIGVEHLVRVLLSDDRVQALCRLLDFDIVAYFQTLSPLVSGPPAVSEGQLPQTPRLKRVVEAAIAVARELDEQVVTTAHLFWGLVKVEEEDSRGSKPTTRETLEELLKLGAQPMRPFAPNAFEAFGLTTAKIRQCLTKEKKPDDSKFLHAIRQQHPDGSEDFAIAKAVILTSAIQSVGFLAEDLVITIRPDQKKLRTTVNFGRLIAPGLLLKEWVDQMKMQTVRFGVSAVNGESQWFRIDDLRFLECGPMASNGMCMLDNLVMVSEHEPVLCIAPTQAERQARMSSDAVKKLQRPVTQEDVDASLQETADLCLKTAELAQQLWRVQTLYQAPVQLSFHSRDAVQIVDQYVRRPIT